MNANEIVVALRERADAANKRGYSGEASERYEIIDLIESLQAMLDAAIAGQETLQMALAKSQSRERAAVEAIRQSLSDTGNQRPHLNRCSQCAKFVADGKQRKYKYGCESLCADALKVIVACGFKSYEPLIPFADEWRGPQAGEGGQDG